MLYGLFSDNHSNLPALEAVMAYFESNRVDSYICCGDIVGYGPNPNECIEIMKSRHNFVAVAGNHDLAAYGGKDITWFEKDAREAIIWTTGQLKPENTEYLKRLENKKIIDTFTIVHGSPRDPIDEYLVYTEELTENIEYFDTSICFAGHTHVPSIFSVARNNRKKADRKPEIKDFRTITGNTGKIELLPERKYIINLGSAGQPRDRDPRACCVLYDSITSSLRYSRIEYDIPAVQSAMRQNNLPESLIDRLSKGL